MRAAQPGPGVAGEVEWTMLGGRGCAASGHRRRVCPWSSPTTWTATAILLRRTADDRRMMTLDPASARRTGPGTWNGACKTTGGTVADCTMDVPGDVHSALLAAGVIADPYHAAERGQPSAMGGRGPSWTLEHSSLQACSAAIGWTRLPCTCNADTFWTLSAKSRINEARWSAARRQPVPTLPVRGSKAVFAAPAKTTYRAALPFRARKKCGLGLLRLPYPVPHSTHGPENSPLEPAAQTDVPRRLGLGDRAARRRRRGRPEPARHAPRPHRTRLLSAASRRRRRLPGGGPGGSARAGGGRPRLAGGI